MTKPAWLIGNVGLDVQDLVVALDVIAGSYALDQALAASVTVAVATGPAASPSVPADTAAVTNLGTCWCRSLTPCPWRTCALVAGSRNLDPVIVAER